MKHEESVLIPRYLLSTLEPSGYFRRFYEVVSASGFNHKEAFFAIYEEQSQFFPRPTYDNYESFRAAKSRFFRGGLVRIMED